MPKRQRPDHHPEENRRRSEKNDDGDKDDITTATSGSSNNGRSSRSSSSSNSRSPSRHRKRSRSRDTRKKDVKDGRDNHKRKKKNKETRRDRNPRHDLDDEDDDEEEHHRHDKKKKRKEEKKKHTKKKKEKKSKKKKSHKRERRSKYSMKDDDASSYSSSSSSSSSSSPSTSPRKKSRRSGHRNSRSIAAANTTTNTSATTHPGSSSNAHTLTQALCDLFTHRPIFAEELPILLIRLVGGSTIDLQAMKQEDPIGYHALEQVLLCLQDYGVIQQTQQQQGNIRGGISSSWIFQSPTISLMMGGHSRRPSGQDERILLRVIRSQLDEVGVTIQAVNLFEQQQQEAPNSRVHTGNNETHNQVANDGPNLQKDDDQVMSQLREVTSTLILKYQDHDENLGIQLASLCETIAQGESICVDGIPDPNLKQGLEELFQLCGLEQSEMIDDDDDDSNDNDDKSNKGDEESLPTMGYGLPDRLSSSWTGEDTVHLRLAAIMEACRNPRRQKTLRGPMRPTQQEINDNSNNDHKFSDDDDEGPYLPGQVPRVRRGPSLLQGPIVEESHEKTASVDGGGGGREEWMVVPGKYDFLGSIKSGQSTKSRGFQNTKSSHQEDGNSMMANIHPAIQAEMDAIRKEHETSRGPSLFEQHRVAKQQRKQQQEQEEAAKANATTGGAKKKRDQWTWNRENDLDAGRRVDKDALHMVLGGAADNLKTKFRGGFE